MAKLQTRIFIGHDADEATDALNASLLDGSWPLVWTGFPILWITPIPVTPGAMQMPRYELHVTAWVETPSAHDPVQALVEAIHEERR